MQIRQTHVALQAQCKARGRVPISRTGGRHRRLLNLISKGDVLDQYFSTLTLAAIGCYWIARDTNSQLMLALSYSGFMLNLFNLIPVSPLDGGRITAIISPKVWLVGVPLLVALFLYNPSPMLILIAILALPQLKAALQQDGGASALPEGYYEVDINTRVNYGVFYLGLAGFLAIMSYELHKMLQP